MKKLLFVLFLITVQLVFSQDILNREVDSLYKEDQFYVGITYNLIGNKPTGLSQKGFSPGFHLGFIKDMPINKARNLAIGLGLGYSTNSFNENLFIKKDDMGNVTYSILDDTNVSYSKNRFSMRLIELPIEFRWRTSNPIDYNFWRVYMGFKLGYLISHTVKYKSDIESFKYSNSIDDFNKFQYGLSLSAGYDTWNVHLYYALSSIFSSNAKIDSKEIDMNVIKIGLIFYVL